MTFRRNMTRRRGKENMPGGENEAGVTQERMSGRLRSRKPVTYNQDDDDESDQDVKSRSPPRARRGRKRQRTPSETSSSSSSSSPSDADGAAGRGDESDEDDYEKMRQKNIRERLELVQSLGITKIKEELKPPKEEPKTPKDKRKTTKQELKPAKESVKKRKPPTPRAKSTRIGSLKQRPSPKKPKTDSVVRSTLDALRAQMARATARKPSGPLPMISLKIPVVEDKQEEEEEEAASKCSEFVSLLRPFLVHRGDESKLSTCSLDTFKKIVSQLSLPEDMIAKTNTTRITSMAFHPSEEKLLIASGSHSGDLGLWDVYNPDEEKCVEVFGPHTRQVNCTTFDRYNPTKILTTSHDGTVRRGDLMKMVFEEVWAHEQVGNDCHATWHDQEDSHSILVSHGTGKVAVVDNRKASKPAGWFHCYERSCRTVMKHPLDGRFFVTSSALGQVRIWDMRQMDVAKPQPVWDLVHPKGLTSAFFSYQGNLLLTTCNDDRLRVYHTAELPGAAKPKVVTNIKHDNHTGQWTSVFKATWHPQREDVFMIGSMDAQRKLQIFGIHGQPVCNLMSENLATIPAVNAWHPTLPIIAAANSAGRVHVFR